MDAKPQEAPGLPVHPPVLYLVALLIGIGLNHRWPISLLAGRWGDIAGMVLIVLGTALMPPVLARFRRAGTSFNPHKPASALITDGPYRFSRNPAYVALTLWYLGIGFLLHNAWVLLFAVALVLVMDRRVIRREEQHLEAKFGDDYRRYKSRVRRWL
jgi:protein-S-isoprenylcysteine O-methyltransferase Ste14